MKRQELPKQILKNYDNNKDSEEQSSEPPPKRKDVEEVGDTWNETSRGGLDEAIKKEELRD